MIKLWFQALKIKHWIKNFFVLAPFLISDKFGINEFLIRSLEGVFLFGIMSSAVYLFNDIIDVRSDREHPKKRFRPIASGQLSVQLAGSVSIFLVLLSLVLAFLLDFKFFFALIFYSINNLSYSLYLKEKTVLDVLSIAFGFVIRAYAGGFLVGIDITNWLVACVFTLSLFLGFGKRRTELGYLEQEAVKARKIHESYTIQKMNLLLGISASITIVTYMLYSLAPDTIALHGTDKIFFTTPFVIYCIYRYLMKVQEKIQGAGPVEIILKDRGFILAGFLWIVLVVFLTHSMK